MKRHLTTIMLFTLTAMMAHGQLVINELMQSNIDCIMDDLNEFPDSWVEIYNPGTSSVSLSGYRIGLTNDASESWALPSKSVAAGKTILVYCDKEGNGMHTDFRIDSGKGSVYLFKGTTVVDKVDLKKQPAPNIAYGRKTNGADEWGYQDTPTPGQDNCGTTCKEILGEPVFSETGRVITDNSTIQLTLSRPDGAPIGTYICYTTDGTEPTFNSTLYQSPITINKTTTIRAKLFCSGYLSPRSTTHSYIYFPNNRALTLPVISIVTDSRYLYDPGIGIYVEGNKADGKNNFEHDWRRPINFEYFENAGTKSKLNQLCETRIQGGATRTNMRKSLAVYANKRFGEKRLKYEFFPDQRPGVNDFKSIVLRNSGNDFDYLYMRDAVIQRTMATHTDLDWQAWRPAIIYLNGEYTGILNIRERSNEDNIYTNYDGLEDLDMIENWWELKEGDWNNWNQFKDFYAGHGQTKEEFEQWIDWQEFFNLMIMNIYYDNQDFPGNNIVFWRPRTEDGRWRFIAKDTDFGLALYTYSKEDAENVAAFNYIEWLYNPNYDPNRNWANQYDHTRLFRRMLDNEDLQREFIDRFAIYMGDFLNYNGTHEVWDPMYQAISTEYPYHRELINKWWPNYKEEVERIDIFLSKRTNHVYQHLASHYNLGTPIPLTINKENSAEISLTFNGIQLSKGVFDGKFYANRAVTLNAQSLSPDKQIKGWNVRMINNNGNVENNTINTPDYTFTMPSCKSLTINPILGNPTGIDAVSPLTGGQGDLTHKVQSGIYNLNGQRVESSKSNAQSPTLPKGIYINNGKKFVIR